MSRSSPSVVCAKTQPFSLKAMRHVFSDGNARSPRKRSFLSRRSGRQSESAWRTENHQMGTRSVSVKPSKTIWQFLRFNGSNHVYQTFRRAKEHCMRPSSWHPPVELSCVEQIIIKRIKRATLFVFLRHHRHELFDEACARRADHALYNQCLWETTHFASTTGTGNRHSSLHRSFR